LFDQLEQEKQTTAFKLLVIDDVFDQYSSNWLRQRLESWSDSELIVNPENIGYLRSVNKAVEQVKTKYALLLNSDIELNSDSIRRIVAPLSRPTVALSTALATDSGANLTLAIPNGRHWIEVDQWLKEITPKYPDAHTAIGYALGVNLELIDRDQLFSTDFLDGYGEDSDLHFRALELGYKSVIADNVIVRHHSGVSYGNKENLNQIRQQNMETFKIKWGPQHRKGLRKWNSSNPTNHIEGYIRNKHKKTSLDADNLLLIPSLDDHSGGSKMVVELFEQLWRTGSTTRIVSTIRDMHRSNSWSATTEGLVSGSVFKNTITTGAGTFDKGARLAKRANTKRTLFFQGPEMLFDNGAFFWATVKHLKEVDYVVCGSPFLADLARTFGAAKTEVIHLGPDINQFYRDQKTAKINKALISSRLNADKGTVFAIPLALHLQKMGYQVETIGFTTDALKLIPGLKHHGQVTARRMNQLMNEAKYIVDTSLFEGLGLTPLEALRAECVPIVTRKGGLESIEIPEGWVFWLESSFLNFDQFSEGIQRHEQTRSANPEDLETFFEKYNQESGIAEAARYLGNI
jgi:glycosyltransferase involved in cell wall biosynthesis